MNKADRARQKQVEKDELSAEANVVIDDPIRTKEGRPDMRIKENRDAFLKDPSANIDGSEDNRLLENRPDLQAHHDANQQNLDNVKEEARAE